jgi:chromosome segregation ATPase
MKEQNLKLAQKDIDEALSTIEELEKSIKENAVSEDAIKRNFMELSKKMQEIEDLLKEEGIL